MKTKLAFGAMLLLVACGAPAQPGFVDAGPCVPSLQTGCASDSKCTIRADNGTPVCGPKGPAVAFADCSSDSQCIAATACFVVPGGNPSFEGGQRCLPICNPTTSAHLACELGGTCELVDKADNTIGFCVRKADGGM
jgi:hypothetical protein